MKVVKEQWTWDPSDWKSIRVASRAVKLNARHVALGLGLQFGHCEETPWNARQEETSEQEGSGG